MYSPKIDERLIPELWRLGRIRRLPMTKLVAEAIERYLAEQRALLDASRETGAAPRAAGTLEHAA